MRQNTGSSITSQDIERGIVNTCRETGLRVQMFVLLFVR